MIKARTGNTVILGIDKENVKRLKDGKPIRVRGSDLNVETDIYIVYGETLNEVQRQLGLPTVQ